MKASISDREAHAVAREEVRERTDDGADEPARRSPAATAGQCALRSSQSMTRCSCASDCCATRDSRLAHQQRRHDADARPAPPSPRSRRPAVALPRSTARPRRHHDRDAVAELVGGRHRALHRLRRGLDAPGVDRDVLRRRAERDEQREPGDRRQVPDRGRCARFATARRRCRSAPAASSCAAARASRCSSGSGSRSTIGAHRNLSE